MKDPAKNFIIGAAVIVVALFTPLFFGVWLPDIVLNSPRTLAVASTADGNRFQVVQYWNHFDFYSTELRHTRPDGTMETHTLDGDDFKSWRVPLTLDSQNRIVSVTLSGGRTKTMEWR